MGRGLREGRGFMVAGLMGVNERVGRDRGGGVACGEGAWLVRGGVACYNGRGLWEGRGLMGHVVSTHIGVT